MKIFSKRAELDIQPPVATPKGRWVIIPLPNLPDDVRVTTFPDGEFEQQEEFIVIYDEDEPTVSIEWSPNKEVRKFEFTFKNHKNGRQPEVLIEYEMGEGT